jgi:hypothetical protein
MNLDFKDQIWKGGFRPTIEAEAFEDKLRAKLGLTNKYDSARISIGRSLAEAKPPDPVRLPNDERGKSEFRASMYHGKRQPVQVDASHAQVSHHLLLSCEC